MKRTTFGLSLLAAVILAGCAPPLQSITVPSAGTVSGKDAAPVTGTADAGQDLAANKAVEAVPGAPAESTIFDIANGMSFAYRRDPFSLMQREIHFDREQTAARLLSDMGGFRTDFIPQEDIEEAQYKEVVEAPQWRVAGVVISESVLALIDTGTRVVDVRPGQTVPDTEWVVIAIDEDSVLLRHRRDVTPKEVRVNLKSQISGFGQQGGGGNFGGPQGGPPGGIGAGAPPGRNSGGDMDPGGDFGGGGK